MTDDRERVRQLAERIDRHRKDRQAAHADLTMTGMYNVLEKLRSGEELTTKEKKIHEQGLVSAFSNRSMMNSTRQCLMLTAGHMI